MKTSRRRFFSLAGVSALALGGIPPIRALGSFANSTSQEVSEFEIGIATYSLRALNLDQVIEAMKDFDLKKVCIKSMHLPLDSSDDEIRNVISRFKEADMDPYGCGVVYMKSEEEVGAEQRSNPCAQSMAEYLHAGKLGEVYMAKGFCYKWRDTIGKASVEPVPSGVDYDLWMGPAPEKPFTKNRFHYNWHWQWEYGNGDMGNQGVYEVDIARMGLGVQLPTRVSAMGGHVMFDDDQETPNKLMTTFEFPNEKGLGDKKIMQFEVRHWISDRGGLDFRTKDTGNNDMTSSANTVGNTFYGSKGIMRKDVKHWEIYMGKDLLPGESGEGEGNHYQNFIDCIKANDKKLNNAPIEEGFYSCALIHLGNISYRLGRSLDFDPLAMKFIGDKEANAMLTKEYRKGFEVPDIV